MIDLNSTAVLTGFHSRGEAWRASQIAGSKKAPARENRGFFNE
jgi:hypothetical protein